MTTFFAHSGQLANLSDGQLLRDHLFQVARLARERAEAACPADSRLAEAAHAAGLLHDLGKYRGEFQLMLKGLPVQREKTYHKQAGAAKAAEFRHWPIAFAIAGHHGGIPDMAAVGNAVKGDHGKRLLPAIWPDATGDCAELRQLAISPPAFSDPLQADLFTRIVFSCLVDADWSDTSSHERQVRKLPPEPAPSLLDAHRWLAGVRCFISEKAKGCRDPRMAALRGEVLADCLAAAGLPPGLFSLTVPTGGGKTLSGLAFALAHAARHRLRRIVYVAPYLSIIEQNADVIRQALGYKAATAEVFEHHSLADPPGDEDQHQLARESAARRAENWDAPVIVTTSVQFFESLFSNRPGRCRKLHNIARSVVLLDECQTLPPGLVAPTCSMLGAIAREIGCSIVLATATPPAFDHTDLKTKALKDVREIITPGLDLFRRLRRVRVEWPSQDQVLDWKAAGDRMMGEQSALCVVNTRRAARDLFAVLAGRRSDGVFHLSTSMCPFHRLTVLERVRQRLLRGEPCYLVSTQLIEAGVDVDFPFVMRELGPLESVIQAAGRCNREGALNGPDGTPGGRVMVFRSIEGILPSDAWYRRGRSVLETQFLNAGRFPQVDEPSDITDYYSRLYSTGELDQYNIEPSRSRSDFASVAEAYQLIDDSGEPVVIATWNSWSNEVAERLDDVRLRPSRTAFRRLVPFSVNLRHDELARMPHLVAQEIPGVWVWRGAYHDTIGLAPELVDILLMV